MTSLTWWIVLLIISVLLELSSPGFFFFLSFSLGAAAAALCAWFEISPSLEFGIFLVVSAVSFVLLTRYIKSLLKETTLHKTNVYALLGKKGLVTETISHCKKGWVTIDGEIWSALPVHEGIIESGSLVEIVSTAGSHVVVRKIQNHC